MGETWNTTNPLHILQIPVSKDSHAHNPHGIDETCVRLRYANRTYAGFLQNNSKFLVFNKICDNESIFSA